MSHLSAHCHKMELYKPESLHPQANMEKLLPMSCFCQSKARKKIWCGSLSVQNIKVVPIRGHNIREKIENSFEISGIISW